MKKITPLVIVLLFTVQAIFSQTLTYSLSQVVEDGNSRACELSSGIIENTTFYRNFKLSDFGITTNYSITDVEFGVEKLINAPATGYPVKVQIYTVSGGFPEGTMTKIAEVTKNLEDQTLTLVEVPISATITTAVDEFVIAVDVPSSSTVSGGGSGITFQIGSNDDGETQSGIRHFSYYSSTVCPDSDIATFSSKGFNDVHLIMNVKGTSATASVGNLAEVDFSYYPNPVKERLNMKANEEITSVEVYNVLGQQVKSMKPSKFEESLDLTSLATGTYMVRATVNDKVGSFKVVKE